MAFVVKEIQPEALRKLSLQTRRNVSYQSDGEGRETAIAPIRSHLSLAEEGKTDPWWSGLFGSSDTPKPRFHILLSQSREQDAAESWFEIYQGYELAESADVLESLCGLLSPLLKPGTVAVTSELLSMLLLPTPKDITDLPAVMLKTSGIDIKQHLNTKFGGKTLLHLACEKGDYESLSACLGAGASVHLTDDGDGSTPLHKAVKHSSENECLKHILTHVGRSFTHETKGDILNHQNHHGYTSLHLACLHNKPDAVESLVKAGAKLSIPSKHSSSNPLHLAAKHDHHECISAINKRYAYLKEDPTTRKDAPQQIDIHNSLNATNSYGNTPLLIAVRKGNVKSALTLLLEGADPNIPNSTTLDHPLGIAAHMANITLVRLLLVFGANLAVTNGRGKTPLDEARESDKSATPKDECIAAIMAVIKGRKELEDTAKEVEVQPLEDGSLFLLSFDGGGIRGLVLAQLLIAIEERMNKLCPTNCPHLTTFFEWIVGTSTGALLALGFSLYKAGPAMSRKMYFKFKNKALAGHRVHPAKDIEASLLETFGHTAVMTDIKGPKVCITTSLADRLPPELHMMCNYGTARDQQLAPSDRLVWQAARASSAAPTYFPAYDMKFLDGGVMANNPTLDGMAEMFSEARNEGRNIKVGCVLSLGTGEVEPADLKHINIVTPHSLSDIFHDAEALAGLADIFIAQSTNSSGQEIHRARAWCESMNTPYFRFSPPIDNITLNETDDDKLIKLLFDTLTYTFDVRAEIDKLVKLLISKRKFC